jgi:DNA-binding NarL/FixJ family response regulator
MIETIERTKRIKKETAEQTAKQKALTERSKQIFKMLSSGEVNIQIHEP